MHEKRRFVRLDVNVKVNWEKIVVAQTAIPDKKDSTKNISEGGICLIVYEKLNVADLLKLEIELPTKRIIQATGRVVWTHEFIIGQPDQKRYDVGIEFLDISAPDREEIKKFVFSVLRQKGA